MPNAFTTQLLDMVEFTDYVATFADKTRKIVDIEPYAYIIDGNVLPQQISLSPAVTFTTPMEGDADFLLIGINGFGRTSTTTLLLANPAIMFQIADASSGRTFFNGPAPMAMIAGQGGFPYLMPGPRVVRARSALKTTAFAAVGQAFNGFYVAYHGARIWYG